MKRLVPLLLLAATVLSLWQAGRRHQPLLEMRRESHLDRGEPLENTPPLVAFTTVALGGFRGIIADLLWLRATRLKEEGKYFELVQLADWITKLEPRFALVWAFHAWNMAYNVSVLFNDPADRWRWVRNGIELLRDEGIFYNPGDPNLYREFGWIYQHKMAGFTDQAQMYYKEAWAHEMMELFEGPRPDYAACARAAASREELLQRPGVAQLVADLKASGQDPSAYALLKPDQLTEPARTRLAQHAAAANELQWYLRVRRLVEDYKLVPRLMEQVESEYGPLDWRLPQAHAIYWAWRGRPYARDFDLVGIDRMIFQSMADAFFQGQLFYNPAEEIFIPSPNLALLPRVRRAYEEAIEKHPDQSAMQSAHRNFMHNAILVLSTAHRIAEARELLEDLHQRYPGDDNSRGLDFFVYRNFTSYASDLSQREATAVVEGSLSQSYFWWAMGDEDRAVGAQQLAILVYEKYRETRTDPKVWERSGLPPLEQLARTAIDRVRESLRSREALERLRQPLPAAPMPLAGETPASR